MTTPWRDEGVLSPSQRGDPRVHSSSPPSVYTTAFTIGRITVRHHLIGIVSVIASRSAFLRLLRVVVSWSPGGRDPSPVPAQIPAHTRVAVHAFLTALPRLCATMLSRMPEEPGAVILVVFHLLSLVHGVVHARRRMPDPLLTVLLQPPRLLLVVVSVAGTADGAVLLTGTTSETRVFNVDLPSSLRPRAAPPSMIIVVAHAQLRVAPLGNAGVVNLSVRGPGLRVCAVSPRVLLLLLHRPDLSHPDLCASLRVN